MSDQLYVRLLDEGVTVWRPVPASKVAADTYVIERPSDYDPDDEHWEFPPGTTVVGERRVTSVGEIIAAVRPAKQQRRTA